MFTPSFNANNIITSCFEHPQSNVPPSYTTNDALGIILFRVKFETLIDFELSALDGENGIICLNHSTVPPDTNVDVIGIHKYKFLPPPACVIINSASAFVPI